MRITQRLQLNRKVRKRRKTIEVPIARQFRQKIKDEFLYDIDLQHFKLLFDLISAVGYLLITIYPSRETKGIPDQYCVAVSRGLGHPCELWFIGFDEDGNPEIISCDLEKPTIKNIHQKILHQQFFHAYNIGRPLVLPPLYSNTHRNETNDIPLKIPSQLREFLTSENRDKTYW